MHNLGPLRSCKALRTIDLRFCDKLTDIDTLGSRDIKIDMADVDLWGCSELQRIAMRTNSHCWSYN